jgi:Fe-S-cluster containining protein
LNVKKKDVDRCDILRKHFVFVTEDKFSLVMPCPALFNNLCSTYETRPKICRDFPIFVDHDNKIITFSNKCPAVMNNKFYPLYQLIVEKGYEIKY